MITPAIRRLLLLLVLPLAASAQPAPVYSANAVRQDLAFLYETLQTSHYDLFARTPKADFDREYARLTGSITGPLDPLGAYRLLQPFVAQAGMAHCNIALPFQPAYVPYVMAGGTVIPFDLTFSTDRARVWHRYADDLPLHPGDDVIAINDRPVGEVLANIERCLSGDSVAIKRTNIETIGLPRLFWFAFGEVKFFRVTVRAPDGTAATHTVAAIPAMQFEQRQAGNAPVTRSDREFKFLDGGMAYLRPGVFLNQGGTDLASHATFAQGEFNRFLDSAFVEILAKRPGCLIVDLRGNPGGDNAFSDALVARFATKPFRFCSRFEVRTSAVTKAFWQDVADPALAMLRQDILQHADGERFAVELPMHAPLPATECYTGKVIVLVDRFSYSNAVTTAALIQDYGFGTILGEPTVDLPTTYAAAHQFTLPNTGFTVLFPKAYMVRPSGDTSVRGVTPDHVVRDDPFTSVDEILAAALNMKKREKG